MGSYKIIVIDSHRSEISNDLICLLNSRNSYDADIKEWNSLPDYPYDLVFPVLIPGEEQWDRVFQDLAHLYEEAAIVPVIHEDNLNDSDALTLLEKWASDFIVYPCRELELIVRTEQYLKKPGLDEVEKAKKRLLEKHGLRRLVGVSDAFLEVVDKIPIVAESDIDVLIQGETGTGKELFARAIHYQSPRRSAPFIAVNSATLPAALFENEMFGHVKEAFTDARSSRTGVIKEAEKGTIFLDEIDSLERAPQAKLLRFLEDRTYKPLGSSKYTKSNVRIITAGNRDLLSRVEANEFRQDLFYRLNVITLTIPPLRDRREDIPVLAGHFLKKYAGRFGVKELSPAAMRILSSHTWPGNIRELENVIQHSMIMSPHPVIEPESMPFKTEEIQANRFCINFQEAKRKTIEQFEREYIYNVLRAHNGNLTQAAKAAGKERSAFGRLVKKYRPSLDEEELQIHDPKKARTT